MKRAMTVMGFSVLVTLITVGVFGVISAWVIALVATALLAVSVFNDKLRAKRVYTVVLLCVIAASVSFGSKLLYEYEPAVSLDGTQAYVDGVICDSTESEYGRFYYTVKTQSINGEKMKIKVRLSLSQPLDADYYDSVSGNFNIYKQGTGSENSLSSYKAKGIYIGGYTYEVPQVVKNHTKPPMFYLLKLRDYIKGNVSAHLTGDEGKLLLGMLIGDKQSLGNEIKENFRTIGLSHLLAVSGLHLSVWSGFVIAIFDKIKFRRKSSAIISMLFVFAFMAVTGFTFSVIRAGIMILIYLFGIVINREPDSLNSLGLAVLVIGLANPFSALDIGFLFSFGATLGIVLLSAFSNA